MLVNCSSSTRTDFGSLESKDQTKLIIHLNKIKNGEYFKKNQPFGKQNPRFSCDQHFSLYQGLII